MNLRRGKQRIPVISGEGNRFIDTGHVDALIYEESVSVHPSVNLPGQGIWTVTHAPTGQGIIHLPTEQEARAFAEALVKTGIPLKFRHFADPPTELRLRLATFVQGWRAQWSRILRGEEESRGLLHNLVAGLKGRGGIGG